MKFTISRTTAHFGVYNPREEKNNGAACDIPFHITIGAEILGMLCPSVLGDDGMIDEHDVGESLANELFSDEGYVRRPALNPLSLNRTPEGVEVIIHDDHGRDGPLVLHGCRLKGIVVELQTPFMLKLSGKIQYQKYTDKELLRINGLMNKDYDIEMRVVQSDLFEPSAPTPAHDENEQAKGKVDEKQLAHDSAPIQPKKKKVTTKTARKPKKAAQKKTSNKKKASSKS